MTLHIHIYLNQSFSRLFLNVLVYYQIKFKPLVKTLTCTKIHTNSFGFLATSVSLSLLVLAFSSLLLDELNFTFLFLLQLHPIGLELSDSILIFLLFLAMQFDLFVSIFLCRSLGRDSTEFCKFILFISLSLLLVPLPLKLSKPSSIIKGFFNFFSSLFLFTFWLK